MSDKQRPNEDTKSDPEEKVAPKRVGFIFDPRSSTLEDMVDAVHRAWDESNQSPDTKRESDPA